MIDVSTMLPGMPIQGNKQERKLLRLFKALSPSNKDTLLAFAEFLNARANEQESDNSPEANDSLSISEPLTIERPDNESVIKAIKRLTATYPMVDKESILHPISDLMTSHMLQGRPAKDVIDDLEVIFLNEYKRMNTRK